MEVVAGNDSGQDEREADEATDIEGHHVAASKNHPEYLVKSDRTGAAAAHKPDALTKK